MTDTPPATYHRLVAQIHLVNVAHRRAGLKMSVDLRLHEGVVGLDLIVPPVPVKAARIKLVNHLHRVPTLLQPRRGR